MLSAKMIQQLETAQNQTTDDFYKKIASRRCAQQGSFIVEGCIALVTGATGFAIVGTALGAVAGAALPVSWIVYKVWDGFEGLQDVESGNWVDRLPEREKQRYLADKAEELKELPAATGNTTTPEAIALDGDTEPQAIDPRKVAPPIAQNWTDKQWQLWNRLILDCPDLRFALFSKVLVISGPQQTGKSSLASAIAYLRAILLGQPCTAVSPHKDAIMLFRGELVGAGGDFEAIQEWYTDMVESFSMNSKRRSLVVDELTQYAGEHEKLGQAIVRTALSESDKHGYAPILINHAKTLSAGFGNIKGVKELLNSSVTQITRRYRDLEYGAMERSPAVELERPGQKAIEFEIPAWLYTPILSRHFPLPKPETTAPECDPFGTAAFQQAERQAAASNVVNFQRQPNLSNLPTELKAIAQFAAKRKIPVTAREVKQCCGPIRTSDYNTDQIRGFFQQLADQNIGTIEGEGDRIQYVFAS